jgi:FG-GAP-like repeat
MLALCRTLAVLRSKIAPVILAFFAASGLALAQDSFMLHYSPAGSGASVINRGDFNNDGIPDIVTGNNGGTGGDGVSVSLGIGDGRFQNPKNSAAGVGTFDMAVGDFNGDGKLDVALAGYISSTQGVLQIMLGNGDGTFTKGQTINLPLIPRSITTADFNNDGKLDLALGIDKVYFFKGAGNGTFSSAGSIVVGSQNFIQEVRVGDFNADGKADIAVSDGFNLFVMWSTGNFSFSTVSLKSTKFGIFATPVDVNQDNFTDLVVTYYTCEVGKDVPPGPCTNWEVLLGSANKTFKQSANMHLSTEFQGLTGATAADVNGDGINDIAAITTAQFPFELAIWLGNPDGSYQSTPLVFSIGSNSSASDLVASDFNRDGKIDFAVPTPGTSSSTGEAVFLNATPRATCTPRTTSPSVTVCQPQDLIYSNSPVQWIADARDTSHPVTAMQIYVDNKLVVNSPSASLNEPLSMALGPHFVVTKAFDKSGANFQSDHHITIYKGTPGETCPTSTSSLTICSPTQNETTTTSLHVFANSDSADAQITAVQVYIDNKLIYNDTTGATYVDTAFAVTKGAHNVVVKAFDANGKSFSESRNINAQ